MERRGFFIDDDDEGELYELASWEMPGISHRRKNDNRAPRAGDELFTGARAFV